MLKKRVLLFARELRTNAKGQRKSCRDASHVNCRLKGEKKEKEREEFSPRKMFPGNNNPLYAKYSGWVGRRKERRGNAIDCRLRRYYYERRDGRFVNESLGLSFFRLLQFYFHFYRVLCKVIPQRKTTLDLESLSKNVSHTAECLF